jgi:hypothetical protein
MVYQAHSTAERGRVNTEEEANVARALPLIDADVRLGYHQDIQGYKYNSAMIRAKIETMEKEVAGVGC